MSLGVLTWNLFHGRSVPAAGRSLRAEFAAMLAGWRWDVAMLQEVPPWWAPRLAAACAASGACVLTSRNSVLPLRRAIAERRPDLIKSNGGGANALLLRGASLTAARAGAVAGRSRRPFARKLLRAWPERRVAQAAWLPDGGLAVNFHGSARAELAREELARLWTWASALAGGAPIVLGGDLNLRERELIAPAGAVHLAQRDVDHVFALGYELSGPPEVLPRTLRRDGGDLELSDHPPLLAGLVPVGSHGS